MSRQLLTLALLASACLAPARGEVASAGATIIDPVNQADHAFVDLPLRWHNVEGGPYWLDGARPRWNAASGVHRVVLEAQQVTRLRLPAGAWLRVENLAAAKCAPPLTVLFASAGAAYLEQAPRRGAEPDVMYFDDAAEATRVARLVNRGACAATLALHVSRSDSLAEREPYRDIVALPLPAQKMYYAADLRIQNYYRLARGAAVNVDVEGPAQLAVHTRLAYDWLHPPRPLDHYALRVDAADSLVRAPLVWRHATHVDARPLVHGAAGPVTTGQLHTRYITLGPGRHPLVLSASDDLWLRLERQPAANYLVPGNAATVPDRGDFGVAQARVSRALDLRADNRLRDGALAGAALLSATPAGAAGSDGARALARDLHRDASYFRALLPANAGADRGPGVARLLVDAVMPVVVPPPPEFDAGSAGAQVQGLDLAYFVPLNSEVPLRFALPARGADSRLRLSFERAATGAPRRLWLSLDGGAERELWLEPRDAAAAPWREAPAAAALRWFAQEAGGEALAASARLQGLGLAALPRAVDSVDLPLPAAAQELRVRIEPGAPLQLAVQLRVGARHRLGDGEYLQALRAIAPSQRLDAFHALLNASVRRAHFVLGPARAARAEVAADQATLAAAGLASRLRAQRDVAGVHSYAAEVGPLDIEAARGVQRQLVGSGSGGGWRIVDFPLDADAALTQRLAAMPQDPAQPEAALLQHWLPTLRLLDTRSQRWVAGVGMAQPRRDDRAAAARASTARSGLDAGRWLAAFEHGSQAVPALRGAARAEAVAGQVRALEALQEPHLAEMLLRAEILHEDDPAARGPLVALAAARYRARGEAELGTGVHVTEFRRSSGPETLAALVAALIEDGEADAALDLGLLLAPDQRPAELLRQAAYRQRRAASLDELLAGAPAAERDFWAGLRAQQAGDETGALADWGLAGSSRSQDFASALRAARALRARSALAFTDAARRAVAIDWARWRASAPGPREWRHAPELVSAHGGIATIAVDAGRELLPAYRASAAHPLRLRAAGPGWLRVELRRAAVGPGTAAGSAVPFVQIDINGVRAVALLSGAAPGFGAEVLGISTPPGVAQHLVVPLAEGLNDVALWADGEELLARPQARVAMLPLIALPQLPGVDPADRATPLSALPRADGLASPADVPEPAAQRPAPLALDTGRDAQIVRLAFAAQRDPGVAAANLAQAEALAAAEGIHPAAQDALGALRATASWAAAAADAPAGERIIPTPGWQPGAPALRLRGRLIGAIPDDVAVLRAGDVMDLALRNFEPAKFRIHVELREPRMLQPAPLTLDLSIDGRVVREVNLDPRTPRANAEVSVATGEHVLRIAPRGAWANQFVLVRVVEPARGNQSLLAAEERRWLIASARQPVTVREPAPAWLRIDWLRGNRVDSEFRAAGTQPLRLAPPAGESEALVRVFALRVQTPPVAPSPVRTTELQFPGPIETPFPQTRASDAPLETIHAFPLSAEGRLAPLFLGAEDGSYGIALARTGRRAVDEDSLGANRNLYWELAGHHWFRSAGREHLRHVALLARRHDAGPETWGARADWAWLPAQAPWWLALSGSAYTQRVEATGGGEGSATLRAKWSLPVEYANRWMNEFSVGGFARALSLDSATPALAAIDQDVYTRYKREHTSGWLLADRVAYRPWLDAEWYGGASLMTRAMNTTLLDHYSFTGGLRQAILPCAVELELRWTGYRPDDTRAQASERQQAGLQWQCDRWGAGRLGGAERRWHFDGGAVYDRDSRQWSFTVSAGLDWGQGHGYGDYPPGAILFRGLRERSLATQFANDQVDAHGE